MLPRPYIMRFFQYGTGARCLVRTLTILAAVALLGFSESNAHAQANPFGNPPNVVDEVLFVEGATALLSTAQAEGIIASADKSSIELAQGAATGTVTLAPIASPFPFNEMIPSWNGTAPEGAGFRVWMRTGDGKQFTPWFEAGTWGQVGDAVTSRIATFPGGQYDIDHLQLQRPASQIEVRIDMVRGKPTGPSPRFQMLALAITNSLGDRKLGRQFGAKSSPLSTSVRSLRTTETLNPGFRSQVVDKKAWIGRICSPASVGMAIDAFGGATPTQTLAAMLYDPASDLFGIWHRSISGAAQMGVRGYIRRFRSFDDVRAELAQGHIICASVRFALGEVKNPPRIYRKRGTLGHIFVIKGFAPGGLVVVNDSASKDYGRDNLWTQEDLAKAWFDKGGVAYVFTGPAQQAAKRTTKQKDVKKAGGKKG
ncbi:MAG: C39 family peptidase [Candidatus Sumerlaeaceae bacterium]|nr:C39 family peptidase [Candidatus Sumerlaeaceae bacterium]